MAGGETKSSLSSNVLQMKFMKRSALRIEIEKSEEEKQHIIDDEHWFLDLPVTQQTESNFISEPSFERCENLVYGRMSFKGFNPEVEKLMKANNTLIDLEEAERRENETNVNDIEMVERYQSVVGTIGKKFTKKRDRQTMDEQNNANTLASSSKKMKKFKKPIDE